MALFPFSKKTRVSSVLIDVGSASVAGAYVHSVEGKAPAIHYTARIPIERRSEESIETAMLRAFENLCTVLVREGAPALQRAAGTGRIDSVMVSVAAPWHATSVRTEGLQAEKPFLFTPALMKDMAAQNVPLPVGKRATGQSVIATLLNGYEIADPFNKKASRAELIILSSAIDEQVADALQKAVLKTFHRQDANFVSFAPVAYTVFRDLYPHEKDFLILDVSGTGTDLAFIKSGHLLDVGSMPLGIAETSQEWLAGLTELLKDFAARHPLPRTLFLLADDHAREFLTRTLNAPALHTLWLSDEPLRIVPVLPGQLASVVETKGGATPDIFLAVLAAYAARTQKTVSPA